MIAFKIPPQHHHHLITMITLYFILIACTYIQSVSCKNINEAGIPSHHFHLAKVLQRSRWNGETINNLYDALLHLQKSQGALKKLDGAAYEAYQRTHDGGSSSSEDMTSVAGRVTRNAQRIGCVADAFFVCELCEILEMEDETEQDLALSEQKEEFGREVVYRGKIDMDGESDVLTPAFKVLCLFEKDYCGGAGLKHGGIDGLSKKNSQEKRGRLIIVIVDDLANDAVKSLECLDYDAYPVQISTGLVTEISCVHKGLWLAAGKVVERIKDALIIRSNATTVLEDDERDENVGDSVETFDDDEDLFLPSIHFVGRSLAGGVAGLAACILDGSLPMPDPVRSRRKRKRKRKKSEITSDEINSSITTHEDSPKTSKSPCSNVISSLSGYGQGRSSAFIMGSPPVLSPNVRAAFVTSLIHGDDIICRTTKDSLDRLNNRMEKALSRGMFTKNIGWMSDAFSLTVSNFYSILSHGISFSRST